MKRAELAHDITHHGHFAEALRHARSRIGARFVGRVIAAGGVAFTLLRSGLGAGRTCRPGHTTPRRVAVGTAPSASVNAFRHDALTRFVFSFGNSRYSREPAYFQLDRRTTK
jgi:hypothetical protein